MTSAAPHERLRSARAERAEDVPALSARTGLRVQHIRAIEEGRFRDLPAGIYARAAIRSFATAYGLDADAVLAECDAFLPRVEDPIDALARSRGIAPAPARAVDAAERPPGSAELRLRPFAAAIVDAAVTGTLLLTVSVAAAVLARVSIAALGAAAISLFLVGVILGAAYYVWLGGLGGTTFGEYAVGPETFRRDPRPLTLSAIARRTLAAATADARAIHRAGMWTGRRLTRAGAARIAPPPAPLPSSPLSRGREEALTWSMNQRASVPPPPLRPRHG
jgi:Helix-turn-helix domain